ncbi:MAG: 7-cyano-7-deazaguanine synthase QueC [Desulforegulaceae bacterium]|jgi:7-cyano-7-deazaguanine synthase|nr:7-cyano-7-deazaguanine synthase QueC [Desulforegulaceae bacterium]
MNKKKALVLLSGGIDSSTCAAIAKNMGFDVYALSFDYNQRHKSELDFADKIARYLGVSEHIVIKSDLSKIGGSALTDEKISVPDFKEGNTKIPVTYVPSRNIIFLSYAVSYAEVIGADDIFIGVTAVDYSGYPDCRPEFIEAFSKAVNLGTKKGIEGNPFKIHTPLLNLSKDQIILKGIELKMDYSFTSSCYNPDVKGRACGKCDSCIIRKKGFEKAGIKDPTIYSN